MVYLMRHAETDWARVNERGWVGLANDFAPLSDRGRRQAAEAAGRVAQLAPARLLSSPMTRAMETAAIIGRRIGLDPIVEIDLREWLPDRHLRWSSPGQVRDAYTAMVAAEAAPPAETVPAWETLAEVRHRGMEVLLRYTAGDGPVLAICHEVIIQAISGHRHTGDCEIRPVSGL